MRHLRWLHDPNQHTSHLDDHDSPASHRDFEARASISLEIHVGGNMGEISFPRFMISWVSTFALCGAVTLALNILMRYVLPLRKVYSELLDHSSPSLSLFRAGESDAVEAVNTILHSNARSRGCREVSRFVHHESQESIGLGRKPADPHSVVFKMPRIQPQEQDARIDVLQAAVSEKAAATQVAELREAISRLEAMIRSQACVRPQAVEQKKQHPEEEPEQVLHL